MVRSDWLLEELFDWWTVSRSSSALFLFFLHFVCFSSSLSLCFNDWALSPLKTPPTPKVTPPPFTLLTEEWFIVGSFAVLSVLTLCYMIIRATGNNYDNTA